MRRALRFGIPATALVVAALTAGTVVAPRAFEARADANKKVLFKKLK